MLNNYKLTDDKSPEVHYHLHNLKNFYPRNQKDLLNLFDYVGKNLLAHAIILKIGKQLNIVKKLLNLKNLYIYSNIKLILIKSQLNLLISTLIFLI